MLWHIMKIYGHYGLSDFIICLGYKGYLIKQFFANYLLNVSDVRFDLHTNRVEFLHRGAEPWKVTLVDTGEKSMTGGRLLRVRHLLGDEAFCMTYGDGVSDVDITKLVQFHREHGRLATVTAIQPPGRFGAFTLPEDDTRIERFREKPSGDGAWVNGGFFVLEPEVLDYVDDELTTFEREPMQGLSRDGQLHAFKYPGFWQSMDTLRDRMYLEELWASGNPPWRIWDRAPSKQSRLQPPGHLAETTINGVPQ
jgi:glucose-1-phosphate cytidylyltransferase